MCTEAAFAAWIFFAESHPPACSPNTIPNNPSRATIGRAGLFTRMTPYTTPTIRPTANQISSAFISRPLSVAQTSEIFSVHRSIRNSAPASLSPVRRPRGCTPPQPSQTERSQSAAVSVPQFQNRTGARPRFPVETDARISRT